MSRVAYLPTSYFGVEEEEMESDFDLEDISMSVSQLEIIVAMLSRTLGDLKTKVANKSRPESEELG